MNERELELALRVIELIDLRDKLLEQNKSYKAALCERPSGDFFETVVRKHKTVANILTALRESKIEHGEAATLLRLAVVENKQFTELQVMREVGKL